MAQEQELSGLKKTLRSLLVSAKNGLTPEQLRRDYLNMVGHPLPLRSLGFRTVMDMVEEMPDAVSVTYTHGTAVLKGVGDKTTRGMEELVSRQRNSRPKAGVRRTLFGNPFVTPSRASSSRAEAPPPPLPAQLRSQLRQLLSQGPVALSELEPCFAKRFGRPLQVTHYGFYSIAEMLAAASDLVVAKQSRSGCHRSRRPALTKLHWTQDKRTRSPTVMGTGLNVPQDSSPSRTLGRGVQHNGAVLPAPKPVQEERAFETSVKELEEEFRNGILDSGTAGTVSPELKEQLRKVVSENSDGISIHDLPAEFKRVTGRDLPVAQCGFLSATEMVSALSDVLYLQPGPQDEANGWIVKNNQGMDTHQGGGQDTDLGAIEKCESLNPSKRGYYLNSEESPWDRKGDGEEPSDILEVHSDLRVTTKTFSQLVEALPVEALRDSGGCAVPLDALCGERLKAPSRRRERELAPVLVERVESPSHFYIRFHETQEARALENMMIEMRTCYTCPEVAERYRLPESRVRPGQACCLAPRGMWFYRVIITRVLSRTEVELYYVDFGDLNTADRSGLKFLKSCYSELPAQAVPSCLTGVRPASGDWSQSAVSCFQKLCCERTLVAAVHSYQEDVLQLFLCDTHTEEDVYMHTALQAQGHALSCPSSYNRVFFGQFNPVTLYMGTGVEEGRGLPEPPAVCSLDSDGSGPDQNHSPLGTPPTGPSPRGGAKLHPIRETESLPDLPELEFIPSPEASSPAQQSNPFGALFSKDPDSFSDWDQGWTPASTPQGTPGDAAQLCPELESSGEESPLRAGPAKETSQHALQAPTTPTTTQPAPGSPSAEPTPTPSRTGGVSPLVLRDRAPTFMFPSLRYASPSLLGPATHLFRWYPYKMA
ncbi:hypothetical protein AAFF_G00032230 [Aldrovandia affinis]|uniref:Tudor domain-containing protein 5 n=1 Tax=Aldrovandia affinis TaxID=143900 RepID=A0AAD7WGV3_9TELE|nr:hypothetical protein AAFF_G00032230 [Aldrovandia affinis]